MIKALKDLKLYFSAIFIFANEFGFVLKQLLKISHNRTPFGVPQSC